MLNFNNGAEIINHILDFKKKSFHEIESYGFNIKLILLRESEWISKPRVLTNDRNIVVIDQNSNKVYSLDSDHVEYINVKYVTKQGKTIEKCYYTSIEELSKNLKIEVYRNLKLKCENF